MNAEETDLKQEIVVKGNKITEEDPRSDIPGKQGWIDDHITAKGEIDIEDCDLASKIYNSDDTTPSAMDQETGDEE